jgi:MFS family permease
MIESDPLEPPTETLPINPQSALKPPGWLYSRIIIVSIGSLINGYCWTLFNNLFSEMAKGYSWNQNPSEKEWFHGLINACYLFGALLGSVFSFLLQNYSRKWNFVVCDLSLVAGGAFLLILDTGCLLVGRTIQGVSIGVALVIIFGYIGELAPDKLLNNLSFMPTFFLVLGQVLAFLVTYLAGFLETQD